MVELNTVTGHQIFATSYENKDMGLLYPMIEIQNILLTSLNGMSMKGTPLHCKIWSPGRNPASRARPFSFVNWTKIPGFHSGPLQILKPKIRTR